LAPLKLESRVVSELTAKLEICCSRRALWQLGQAGAVFKTSASNFSPQSRQ
jgi:hypothetical protein